MPAGTLAPGSDQATSPSTANPARILVIDDDPDMCEACQRILGRQGLIVELTTSGREGLAKVQSDGYDLVLVDVMMPDVNGIDLLEPIRAHDPEIVCVVITCCSTVDIAVRAIKQGAYDFITKPFTPDDLLLVVRQGLERRQLALEAARLHYIEAEAKHLAEEKSRLEAIDRARTECIRLITHELRAPIAAIQSYLNLILDGCVPPEKVVEVVAKAEARARQQLDLIADLLELSQVKEKPVCSTVPLCDVAEILREVVEELETQAAVKQLQVELSIADDVPPVRILADQLRSIWTNLIGNAIKYTPEGGRVDIVLRREDGWVRGEVRDTGIGIPADAQARLFTEFFRAKNAKAFCPQGTGLGLAIVRNIVEAAGGRITVESQVGQGTTFRVVLPTPADSEAPAADGETCDGAAAGPGLAEADAQIASSRLRGDRCCLL